MLPELFQNLLQARGLDEPAARQAFLSPDYNLLADPYLLPDMKNAVKRIVRAHKNQEQVVIYGDYDIDGLSATALLYEALTALGLQVSTFIPSRFEEGYGLSKAALTQLSKKGAQLVITVDCGSNSNEEVIHATAKNIDIIVTDHHTINSVLPKAVAVINPKRDDHTYPFRDFSGVGVAFGLVRALQTKLPGLTKGHEKWLLDLVALGTVCDVVSLTGENRILAYWGLAVMKKTRRPGLKALMAVAGIEPASLSARSLGFGLGPRLNASGRLETAQISLDLLITKDNKQALAYAEQLQAMNTLRRADQQKIVVAAKEQAVKYKDDPVLVLSNPDWNHGIVGIVASKLMETYHKPVFVLQEMGTEAKGSGRSFGDFSLAEAIKKIKKLTLKGGGHDAAAGLMLPSKNIDPFRDALNKYYVSLKLSPQAEYMRTKPELELQSFKGLDETLVRHLASLEPYGHGNPEPLFGFNELLVVNQRVMGERKQHVKLALQDSEGKNMHMIAFSAPAHFFVEAGTRVNICCTLSINEWQGSRSVEGRLVALTPLL